MTELGKPKPVGTLPVIDIIHPFTLTIDEVDRQAWTCDPWECVIANCLNRQKGISRAQVGAQFVRFMKGNVPVRGELSHNARQMIRAYDKDGQIMPAGVQIKILPPSRKLGDGRPSSKVPKDQQKPGQKQRIRRDNNPSTRNIFVKPPHDDHS